MTESKLSRRNFIGAAAVAAAGSALAATGCSSASPSESTSESATEPATTQLTGETLYHGSSMGKNGYIDLDVVMDGDTITDILVKRSHETNGVGSVGVEKTIELIVNNQSLNVDTIAGATLSSTAVNLAIQEALESAGQDVSQWRGRDHGTLTPSSDVPTQVDVVVVGGGLAGYAAAISAKNAGATVMLVEKQGTFGGSTALSGGAMAVPDTWMQHRDGIEDSAELMASDMLTGGDDQGNPELVEVVAKGAKDGLDFLTFEGSVAWEPVMNFFGGHSVKRSILPKGHKGAELTTKMEERCQFLGISTFTNMQATKLLTDADGAINGINLTDTTNDDEYSITCKSVVLATGGFGRNTEMVNEYTDNLDGVLATTAVGAEGQGILMASELDAKLADMEFIQTYPNCDPVTGALQYLGNFRFAGRGIMINIEGDRFVEELDRRDVLSDAIRAQTDGCGYMIFNQEGADATKFLETYNDEYLNLSSRELLFEGDTLEEACEGFGIDAEELQKTLDTWNSDVEAGEDTQFHFRGALNKIEGGKYYIFKYVPAIHYTMGGLAIDAQGHVPTNDGQIIKGLYAAGEVTGDIMGTNRLGSTAITDCTVFGRIAGTNAATLA